MLDSKTLDTIEAKCEANKRLNCPGVVLPVAQVEELVRMYKVAGNVRRFCLSACNAHDLEMIRSQVKQLPDLPGPMWPTA